MLNVLTGIETTCVPIGGYLRAGRRPAVVAEHDRNAGPPSSLSNIFLQWPCALSGCQHADHPIWLGRRVVICSSGPRLPQPARRPGHAVRLPSGARAAGSRRGSAVVWSCVPALLSSASRTATANGRPRLGLGSVLSSANLQPVTESHCTPGVLSLVSA